MENSRLFSILVVDDEASNLHIVNHVLDGKYTVYAAKTGKAALKIAEEKRPDIILLDVLLPDISGYDVLIELKNSDATRAIPVIIISGLTDTESEKKGLSFGASGYIKKPFDCVGLREKIELLLVH